MSNTNSTIEIGLSEQQRQAVVDILNRSLADLQVLYTRTRNYHWNVVGARFHSLHALFEQQYTALAEEIDQVAERVRMLGKPSLGTLAEFLQVAQLKEQPGDRPDADTMLANLVADHETIIRTLRTDLEACAEEYHDQGTSDFLTGLLEQHEKMAWMLRSSISQ